MNGSSISQARAWFWALFGFGVAACGVFTSGTESGNPSYGPDLPTLPDGPDRPAEHSVSIPGSGSRGMLPTSLSSPVGAAPNSAKPSPSAHASVTGSETTGSDGVMPSAPKPPPPVGVASTVIQPRPSSAGPLIPAPSTADLPSTAPCAAPTVAGVSCDSACPAVAAADAASLARPLNVTVPSYQSGSCQNDGGAQFCRCTAESGEMLDVGSAADCALAGRFDCLLRSADFNACTSPSASSAGLSSPPAPSGSAGPVPVTSDCLAVCITATELLTQDAAALHTVEALSAHCAAGICQYAVRVDAATCFSQPGFTKTACPGP